MERRGFTVDGQEGVKDPLGMSALRLEVEAHIVTASATAVPSKKPGLPAVYIFTTLPQANSRNSSSFNQPWSTCSYASWSTWLMSGTSQWPMSELNRGRRVAWSGFVDLSNASLTVGSSASHPK